MRLKNGSVDVTDGPYAETKEMLGGILLLAGRDSNHAIALMLQHPCVKAAPFKSADEILMSSRMLGTDGQWATFMSGTLKRVK